jgi:hypothetical protein
VTVPVGISFNRSPDKFLRGIDVPIVLEGDRSTVDLNDLATPCCPVREQELHKGFERIPLSLSAQGQTDGGNTNNRQSGIHRITIDQHPRRESPPSAHSAEDRSAHESKGRDEPNGRAAPEGDVHSSKGRVRFAKKPTASTSIHQSPISNPFRSNRSSRPQERTGGLRTGDRCMRGGLVTGKHGNASFKKRPISDKVLHNLPIKRRDNWPEVFTARSSDSSDSEGETTHQPIDAPRCRKKVTFDSREYPP